ncbi:hypothetical protein GQ457_12G022950 [Hibiscus cannabinus]
MSYDPYFWPAVNAVIGKHTKLFAKQLTETDVNSKQCRVSISKSDVESNVQPLLKEDENIHHGIRVKVYDANGNEYPMVLKCWSNKLNVLIEGWTEFCTDHGLLALQGFLTILAFRHVQTDDLCFVISPRREEVFEPAGTETHGPGFGSQSSDPVKPSEHFFNDLSNAADGSTAVNDDMAESEVEGSMLRLVSRHDDSSKRFIGVICCSEVPKEIKLGNLKNRQPFHGSISLCHGCYMYLSIPTL